MEPQQPRTTIHDVAHAAGVSISTVSRVLSGRDDIQMRAETRERVLQAIEELGYRPSRSAQRMRRQRCDIIGVLVPDVSNPYFSLLARGVESIAFERGYSTLICDSNHSEDRESRYLDLLSAEQVDGIVFVPVGVPDGSRIRRLRGQGVRIVVADRCVDGLLGVEAANWQGSRNLARHVLALGHRHIAYIGGPPDVRTTQERVRGFLDAMSEAGIEPVEVEYGEYTYESGVEIAGKLLAGASIDVIMAGDDLVALGAMRAAESKGLRVPRDLGVTGFDAVPLLSLIEPTLTSVRIPVFDIGRESMTMLIEHIGTSGGEGTRRMLDVEIVSGASCVASERSAAAGAPPA